MNFIDYNDVYISYTMTDYNYYIYIKYVQKYIVKYRKIFICNYIQIIVLLGL